MKPTEKNSPSTSPPLRMSHLGALAAGLVLMASLTARAQPVFKIDGSNTVFPVTEAVAEEFKKELKGKARVTVGAILHRSSGKGQMMLGERPPGELTGKCYRTRETVRCSCSGERRYRDFAPTVRQTTSP